MEQATTLDEFVRAPAGKWAVAGTTLGWCHSPTLGGTVCWGRPDAATARAAMRLYDAYRQLAPRFDVIIDGSLMEAVLPDAVEVLMNWARAEIDEIKRRVRGSVGVVPPGVDGLALAGISPHLDHPYPIKLVSDAGEGFRRFLPSGGQALAEEVAALVAAARGTAPALVGLRSLLRAREGRLSLDEAARALGVSTRSLQRLLADAASSFRAELLDARFEIATRLLSLTDDKVGAVAAHLGITKSALSTLVRERTGHRPLDYRRELRAKR